MPASATIARGTALTKDQLAALRPNVIAMSNGLLATRAGAAAPATVADFTTTQADIDAIFSTHLPAFLDAHDGTVPIVLWAHGGLVDKAAGFDIAQRQVQWWRDNGVYPIEFVWESGIWTSIAGAIDRRITGRGLGEVATEISDTIIETTARLFGGAGVWGEMKLDAAAASAPGGAAQRLIAALAAWLKKNPNRVTVHAVGHSAGSIFHAHLLPVAAAAGIPVKTVNLLAPAVRVDTFKKLVLPLAQTGAIGRLAIFTMDDATERKDNCLGAYRKSLLYLVSGAFEPARGTRILGMEKHLHADAQVDSFFSPGAGRRGDLVLSPKGGAALDSKTTSHSHGGFDGDGPTMDSVLRRVLGRDTIARPYPVPTTKDVEIEVELPQAPVDRAVEPGKRALCIGINAYPNRADRLSGAVADAGRWRDAFTELGFAVRELHDEKATRDGILSAIIDLVTTARSGDVIAIQYSGHGTTVPDTDGDEADDTDEALCPVDFRTEGRIILDDDLGRVWDLIPDGVRVTIFADSCHSGSVNRAPGDLPANAKKRFAKLSDRQVEAIRVARGRGTAAQAGARAAVVSSEPRPIGSRAPRPAGGREGLVSACRSTEVAWESDGQGHFTRAATAILVSSVRSGMTNRSFVDAVVAGIDDGGLQTPEWHGTSVIARRRLLAAGSGSDAADASADAAGEGADAEGASAAVAGAAIAASAHGLSTGQNTPERADAIAAFLRATADLLES
jgi:hypothetical protein